MASRKNSKRSIAFYVTVEMRSWGYSTRVGLRLKNFTLSWSSM
ncbi:unannotated protein [freshwater metagenome]|uniref:Unannotated protein n=1 Tax=freshwater metagenome TaxID=449393 RepID=A0A6J6X5Z9_9ZZZZ